MSKPKYKLNYSDESRRLRNVIARIKGHDDNEFSRRWPFLYFKELTVREMVLLGITLKHQEKRVGGQQLNGRPELVFIIKNEETLNEAESFLRNGDTKAFRAMIMLLAT